MKRKICLATLAVLIFLIGGFTLYHSQYRIRWQCRKFLQGMEQEGPVSMKLKYVELDQKSQEFYCRYSIKGDGGFTKENLKDFLLVKDLAEKLLVECGEIPATYKIDVEIRGETPSYVENITFGNRDIYKKLEPQRSNGYQLFSVQIGVSCYLSELAPLTGVKILELGSWVTVDNLSGLENMGELQHIIQWHSKNLPESIPFSREDIQKIKEMYPGCCVQIVGDE